MFNPKLLILETILPIHFQAPTTFFFISFYLGGSYLLSGFFSASLLLVNLYLLPDIPLLS